jgi:hypothetical protein
MLILISVWVAVGTGLMLIVSQKQPGSAGLPLAYFVGISLNHFPGAMLYLDDEGSSFVGAATRVGFEQSVIGMIAFLVGVAIAKYTFVPTPRLQAGEWPRQGFNPQSLRLLDRLALLYLLIGAVAYFIVLPFAGRVPSVTAVVSTLGSLIVVGACLRFWIANESADWRKFWFTMSLLPLLPLGTLVQGGFLGFGTTWAATVVTFLFAQSRQRLGYFLLAPAVFFVGLSVFVNYMAARNDIRQLVWYQQASFGDRIQRIAEVFQNFEWLDLSNSRHREAIDDRLNQNWLVGAAVGRLQSGEVEYLSGATLGNMFIALVPRVVWPDKPAVAGSGSLVHDLTGIEFAEGTSVGAGQVLEFYANFGTFGLIGGFLLFGWLLGRVDTQIIESLWRWNQTGFVFWYLIGLAMLQPGGSLLEVAVGAAVAAITGHYVLRPLLKRYTQTTRLPNTARTMDRSTMR